MTETYRFAEVNIAITALHEDTARLCADYIAPGGRPDLTVRTDQADIDFEREKSAREAAREGAPLRHFPDGYLETLAVLRKIAERMPFFDTILFHGSCVAVDGQGYLFTAKSGTGKSTHTRLWREYLGDRALMVDDDKPLIRLTEQGAVICGTPWNGKHRLSTNISVPLKALCLLERGKENTIRQIPSAEALPFLLQQVYRPGDREALVRTLDLIGRLSGSVRLYRLSCNMDPEAAVTAYEAMKD